jgi:hypothetical protein
MPCLTVFSLWHGGGAARLFPERAARRFWKGYELGTKTLEGE